MIKRPTLKESLNLLEQYQKYNKHCNQALLDYYSLKDTQEFLAARIIVDTVYDFYCINDLESIING